MNNERVFDFKISDSLIDNPLISKKELLNYDINECYNKVKEEINKYISYQFNYPYIQKPRITSNYEIRYECFVPKAVDKIGQYVEKVCTMEEKIVRLYSDISLGLSSLSKSEFTYFLNCLYFKKSENSCIEELQTTRFLFNHLKASCIVKLAIALDVAKHN